MFDLGSIVNASDLYAPQGILVYGVQGLGKTTFGTSFEKPILLRIEDGAAAIDVPTFPKIAESFADIYSAIESLHGEHDFKTLIIDSLDWAEPLVQKYTCQRLDINTLEDLGYGKGYLAADDDWRYIMGGLDSLRLTKGITIVLIAHAEVKRHEPPDGEPYDRYQIKLQKRVWPLWQEWADMVLFCNYQRSTVAVNPNDKKSTKVRAQSTGERIIYTEERPAYLAKNRWSLPPEIFIGQDRQWAAFHQQLSIATKGKYTLPRNLQQTQE